MISFVEVGGWLEENGLVNVGSGECIVILGMNYSKRKNGNCRGTLEIISPFVPPDEFAILNIPEFSIKSC